MTPAPLDQTPRDRSLMRNLGAFFGHIWSAATGPVEKRVAESSAAVSEGAERRVVGTQVQEGRVQTAAGPVTLRRTTIDEVIIPSAREGHDPGPGGAEAR